MIRQNGHSVRHDGRGEPDLDALGQKSSRPSEAMHALEDRAEYWTRFSTPKDALIK
jgi:hypothetical protein